MGKGFQQQAGQYEQLFEQALGFLGKISKIGEKIQAFELQYPMCLANLSTFLDRYDQDVPTLE